MPETMKHKGRWIALAVVLAAAVLAGVRVYVTDTFPDGVTLEWHFRKRNDSGWGEEGSGPERE